jgi:WD40 repeat protein/DNA-binding SARP family transcriptional activator
MEFRILGPLEVDGEFGAVALGGIKPRAVLAVLLLHPNQPVSAERLALALWGEDAPAGATRTVQVHVSRLRKALGDPEAVATTPAGYRLRVRPDELDAERFGRGVEAGRRALGAGLPEQAAALLREALELWRGPPLAELEFERFAQAEIARLEEQRLAALEARVEADLGAGRHAPLVSELRQLLAEHPARERLAAQLMLALYRSGRQAEALQVYREARRGLVDEAGIEPGPELQRLHEAVLDQDPSLELQAPVSDLPRELDAGSAPPLVGRDVELARLREHWEAARIGAGRLVTVCGAEGMGTTRLAAELAGEVHRAGGVVRHLAGRGPPAAVLSALGELREVTRPTLVVLDDADRAGGGVSAALGALALAGVPVLVLVTGRAALAGVAADDALLLAPLGAEAVRVAAAAADVPAEWLLDASGGVPRRVHEMVSRWAQREAARRVELAAGRTAAGRAELRSMEAELAGGVIELQAAQDRAESDDDNDAPVRCPFKGLASFDAADAAYFFGRERLVAELVARLVGASLLGVVGPSGSGKSSVVRAGLLPALAGGVLPGSAEWAQVVMRPGEHPSRELANVTSGIGRARRVLLAVDQFEETFTACRDEHERSAFVAELVAAHEGAHIVVLAIRADYYGRCGAYPELSRLLAAHHVLVSAMRRDELHRAVERPALRAGLRVEPALTDALVADVEHEPGALPMLSTALLELWQRRDGRRLRLATYEDTGGVRGAVARHAEDAFARLDPPQQNVARSVLLRLATEGAGDAIERRRVPLAELETDDEDVTKVVAQLTDERLLTVSAGAVELAHEALLREWPRLRGWLEEDAEGRRLHRHLADAARDWNDGGRDADDLYRGARLAAALEWRARHEPDLNPTERAYLDAGVSAEQSELHAARARRRRTVTLGIAVLVVITGISTILAVRGIQRARFEQRASASRSLAAQAVAHLDDNLALAGLLGLEAYRREPTVEARSAVLSVLPALDAFRRLGRPLEHGGGLEGVAISPDGHTLASAADNGTVSLWDVATHRRLGQPLTGHTASVNDVAFSPDGTLLASASDDATVRLWDLATRRPAGRPLRSHAQLLTSVAFSPDGKTLVTGGSGVDIKRITLRIWDVATRRPLGRPLATPTATLNDMEQSIVARFSPDGLLLASVAQDHKVRLWDVAARRQIGALSADTNRVRTIAFSPDRKTLASAADDGTVRLWNVRARRQLGRPLEGHEGPVRSVAFDADGSTLASGGDDATVRLWSVADGRSLGALVSDTDRPADPAALGRVAAILSVAFSPRGGILASAGEQGAVQLWDVRSRRALGRPLQGHRDWVRSIAFVSGDTLASAGIDQTLRLWDTRTQQQRGPPMQSTGYVLSVAPSPDGRTLAVAGGDGTLRIWDARSHRQLGRPLKGHAGTVKGVAFSPDGDTLASGGYDGTVRLWDVDSRRPIGPPLDARAGAVNGVAFRQDGEILAAAGMDGTVRLWDVGDRRPLGRPLRGHTGFVSAVAFSPDGDVLASAGRDGAVWLWDVDARRPLGPPLTGHTDIVSAVTFSPDGRTLASAGADHTVRLWDASTRRALGRPLEGHTGWVSAVAFSPRGDQLASAGQDQTVRLWDPLLWSDDSRALEHRLCGSFQRSLTRTEWARFLPDRPYHQTCQGWH